MVDCDETPLPLFLVDHPEVRLPPLEFDYIEQGRFEEQTAASGGFHFNLVIDDKLHRGFPGMITARNEEGDVGFLDREFR